MLPKHPELIPTVALALQYFNCLLTCPNKIDLFQERDCVLFIAASVAPSTVINMRYNFMEWMKEQYGVNFQYKQKTKEELTDKK